MITKVMRWRGALAMASKALRMREAASLNIGIPGCCKSSSALGAVGVAVGIAVGTFVGVFVGVDVGAGVAVGVAV